MSLPITRFNVNFYIPLYYPSVGGNNCIPKISALLGTNPSWVNYLYQFTSFGGQLCSVRQQALPDVNDLTLWKIVYQPSPFIPLPY
jgi:hypothetical protein